MQRFLSLGYKVMFLGVALSGWLAAQAMSSGLQFDISAGAASTTLKQFAAQAHMQLLFDYRAVSKLRTPAVKGQLTPIEALRQLLEKSGFTFTEINDHTIAVMAPGASPTSMATQQQSSSPIEGPDASGGTFGMTPGHSPILAQNANSATSNTVGSSQSAEKKAAARESAPAEIEEIVVTAQRREESLAKVPISVTALSQRSMDDLQIQSLADLATIVPGLYVAPVLGANQDATSIAVRGILSGNNAPTTQIYIDETPIGIRQLLGAGPSGSPQPLIFDLDRVEVLRGPQGTLFGASAMGGALRFITPQPSLHDASGFAKADVSHTDGGDWNYEVGAAYGAPLIDSVAAFRLSAWFRSDGGFIDQQDPHTGAEIGKDINTSDAYVIRPAVTLAPADGFTITPSFYLQHKHSQNPNSYWVTDLPQPSDRPTWGGLSQPLSDDLKVASIAIKVDAAGLSFQSDSSYLDRELTESSDFTNFVQYLFSGSSFIPGVSPSFHSEWTDNSSTRAWQQELRVSPHEPSSSFNWVAGMYFRRAVEGLEQRIEPDLSPITKAIAGENSLTYFGIPDYSYDGQELNSYTNFRSTDVSEALFGDLTIGLGPGVKADLGVRAEHEVVEQQNEIVAGPINGVAYSNTTLPDQKGNPITPRASVTYQYTENDMVYVSAAKGYRPGGGNATTSVDNSLCDPSLRALGLSSVPQTFKSDSLWSYEIGTKNILFDRRLSIEGSVYYINWSNIQSEILLPSCQETFTTNQGRAISQGFDLQVAAVLAEGLDLHVYAGYTDTYYPQAAYGAPVNGVVPLLNGAGDKLSQILPWTAAVNVEYSHDIDGWWPASRAYIRLDYRWLGAANSPDPRVANYDPQTGSHPDPAYGVLNIRAGIRHGGWDVSAYVDNVTNADPALAYFNWGAGDTLIRATAIPPLRVGATAWFRF